MSNFRAKASEIKAAGVAERGNFEPSGVPLRMYNYWLHKSNSDRAEAILDGRRRENFCHFWRVVAIWAPLMFLVHKIEDFASTRVGQATLVGLVVLALVLGGFLSHGFLSLLIGLGIGTAVGLTLVGIGFGIHYLIKRYWNSDWNEPVGTALGIAFFVVWGAVMLTMLVVGIIQEGWIILVFVLGALAGVALIAFGASALADYISGRRKLKCDAENERVAKMTDEEYVSYREAQLKTREPGKVAKFFSGVGDFLVLAFQVVRVKKWKICPMVSIND